MTLFRRVILEYMDFSLIGLSIRDKRIYEALVRYPESSIRKAAEATGINRGSVLESLKSLQSAGLVTTTPYGKRLAYRAKDPEVIREIIDEKQQALRGATQRLDGYIASLGGQAQDAALFHFVSSYRGDEGLAMILRDVLKTCRLQGIADYRAISSPKVSRYLYNNFPHFSRQRAAQRLTVKVLRQGQRVSEPAGFAESRFLGSSPHDTGCYTLIYGAKVAVITIDQYNETSGVIIDNHYFADIQRQLFDLMWQALEPAASSPD